MVEATQYLPTVAWTTTINDVVMLSAGSGIIPGTYRVTIIPSNINEPGAEDAIKEVGFYIKDFVGYVYRITQINVDGDPNKVVVSDDFLTGYGPQTGRTAVVYKSVGVGVSPYIAPVEHKRLDQSALDYSRKVELDILYKRLYNEVFENDLGKWLLNTFNNNVEFGQALGQDNSINGNRSIAIGQGNTTDSYMEIVLGAYNTLASGQTSTSWVETDRLLTLGNGQSNSSRSLALQVFKSGWTKFNNAITLGKYSNGSVNPPNGTLQFDLKAQLSLGNIWYDLLIGLSLSNNTLLKWNTNYMTSISNTIGYLYNDGNGNFSYSNITDTNYYPNSISFGTGTGTLSLSGPGVSLSTSLDGRYSLLGHTHNYDNYSYWLAYINGGNSITVGSTSYINFVSGTNMTISKSGNDIIFASTGSTNYWTSSSGWIYPNNTTNRVLIGKTSIGNINYYLDVSGTINTDQAFYAGVIYSRTGVLIETHYECKKLSGDANINSGYGGFYCKTDGKPYFKNDVGTVYDLSGSGGDTYKVLVQGEATPYYLSNSYFYSSGGYIVPVISTTPTSGETAPISSGAVYTALLDKAYKFGNSSQYFFASEYNYGGSSYWNTYGESGSTFKIQYYNGSWSIKSYLDLSGNWYANNFILNSDRRLKRNIKSIDTSRKNIRFVEFQMNNSNDKRYGVIAQEVEEVVPELVRTNDDGKKSVAYIDLLIMKIAELEERIKQLENK